MESFSVKDIVSAVGGKLLCGDEKTMVTNICIDSRDAGMARFSCRLSVSVWTP